MFASPRSTFFIYGMFSFCLRKPRICRCLNQVSWYLAAASLSSFSVPQSGQTQPSSFCLIVLLQLFSLILPGTSCISVWHYLQPGVTLYRLHQPSQCYPYISLIGDNLLATNVSDCRWTSSACLFIEKPLSTAPWPCERTSSILTTFHNLLYMSLPAMFSCIRIFTLDLTWWKFTKRSHSLSIMEAAYSEC